MSTGRRRPRFSSVRQASNITWRCLASYRRQTSICRRAMANIIIVWYMVLRSAAVAAAEAATRCRQRRLCDRLLYNNGAASRPACRPTVLSPRRYIDLVRESVASSINSLHVECDDVWPVRGPPRQVSHRTELTCRGSLTMTWPSLVSNAGAASCLAVADSTALTKPAVRLHYLLRTILHCSIVNDN